MFTFFFRYSFESMNPCPHLSTLSSRFLDFRFRANAPCFIYRRDKAILFRHSRAIYSSCLMTSFHLLSFLFLSEQTESRIEFAVPFSFHCLGRIPPYIHKIHDCVLRPRRPCLINLSRILGGFNCSLFNLPYKYS